MKIEQEEEERANKFFKLKVKKLLTRIRNEEGKTVEFNESQWAMLEGLEEYRFWVHIAGRRTGKSFAAAILALLKMLEPNKHVAIVAPNYTLSSIIWDYLVNLIRQLQLEPERQSTKDRVIILGNGSSVRLLSENNRGTLIGRGYHLVIVDEAAVIETDQYFLQDMRPTLATYDNTRCLFISTPRGKNNYLYKYYERGQKQLIKQDEEDPYPEWGSGLYTWRSNPRLRKEEIEEQKRSMSRALFAQEYECSWLSFENMIFAIPPESEKENVYSSIKGRRMEFIAGLDIGFRDDTAFVVIATDYNNFYIVDEYVVNETITSELARNIQVLESKYNIQAIYIDAAAQQMKADLANDYDIYCENAIKDVNAGIAHLQNLIEKGNIIFDKTGVPKTLASMQQYRWNAQTTVTIKPVHDKSSHCCDAVRYAIYTHAKNQVSIYTG